MTGETSTDLESRVAALEDAVARLAQPGRLPADQPEGPSEDELWVLHGLRERGVDGALMAGSLTVPGAGPVAWQYGLSSSALLELDWAQSAATVDALSHPARLTILQLVLSGVRSTAGLLEQESLGTTGQLHHHLRQLVAAGWLSLVKRGEYAVPVHRVVPLLVVILAVQR